MTPLHYAVEGNHDDIVRFLLANGAEINVRGKNGETPAYIAGVNRNYDLLTLLLAHGADIDVSGTIGTLLEQAARFNDLELAKFLLLNNAKDDPLALSEAAYYHSLAIAELLINRGADVNAAHGFDGLLSGTALHAAAYKADVEMVKLLLKHNADVNARDDDRRTALHVVGRHLWGARTSISDDDARALEIAKLLIAKGAGINVTDKSGWTPLDTAEGLDQEGLPFIPTRRLSVAKLLKDSGAKHKTANR